MSLSFRTARSTIENVLVDTLRLAYGRRQPPVQAPDDLALVSAASIPDESLRFVSSEERSYRWQPWNTSAPDGRMTIAPRGADLEAPGRWVRTDSSVASGYLKRCELYNEDEDEETITTRLLAEKPALLISFEGARHKPVSGRAGALYWYVLNYSILAISTNLRGGQAARQGSPRAVEAVGDPGTAAMLGDVKAALAGSSLGLDDVERVELGEEKPVIVALAKRTVVESLEVTVWATLTNEVDDAVPLADPHAFDVQRQLASDDSRELVNFGPPDEVTPARF